MFVNRAKNWVAGLAVAAVLMLSASSASAISLTLVGANGQDVSPGDQVTVTVNFDTDTTVGITLMSIGVLFDDTLLAYNKAASSTTSYLLYGGKGGGGFLKASDTCGGYPSPGGFYSHSGSCSLRVNTTNQVNIDYVSADLSNGTVNTGTVSPLTTLVFDVLAGGGSAAITLSQTSPGNVIGQPGGGSTTATLNSGVGSVNVIPEPTTALLVGLGLAGLGVAGRRRA